MIDIDFNKYPLPARTRHHTNPSYYIALDELKYIPSGYPTLINNIDWKSIFLNGQPPKRLDIGCGRGLFLLNLADADKDSNVLGIEVRSWCCQWLEHYIKNENIKNCGIIRYCVANLLPFIEAESIDEIYYLFPDPWVKNKHKKRRAFNDNFLNDVYRLLCANGKLYLATDLLEVHNYHIKVLKQCGKFDVQEVNCTEDWSKPITNKELFCIKENIPYFRMIASKKILI